MGSPTALPEFLCRCKWTGYNFLEVVRWFAKRGELCFNLSLGFIIPVPKELGIQDGALPQSEGADLILLLFDPDRPRSQTRIMLDEG